MCQELNFEALKNKKEQKKDEKRIERQLYDTANIQQSYINDNIGSGNITAGIKCLQRYLESGYVGKLSDETLSRISQIQPPPPEPDFEMKNQQELDAMNKSQRNRYKERVSQFISTSSATWAQNNMAAIKGAQGQAQEEIRQLKRNLLSLKEDGDITLIIEKFKNLPLDNVEARSAFAQVLVENVARKASKFVAEDKYISKNSYTIERADTMRIVLSLSSSPQANELLTQIEKHEESIRFASNRLDALDSFKFIVDENIANSVEVMNSVQAAKLEMQEMIQQAEREGEWLEEQVSAIIESRAVDAEQDFSVRKSRLSKYVSAKKIREFRQSLGDAMRQQNAAELPDNKAKLKLSEKTRLSKQKSEDVKRQAKTITKENEVLKNSIQTGEKMSLASTKYIVNLQDAKRISDSSNGFIFYEELKEKPGLYQLKSTMPTKLERNSNLNPEVKSFNPRVGMINLMKDIANLGKKYLSAKTIKEEKKYMDNLDNLVAECTNLNYEDYLKYVGIKADDVTEERKNEIMQTLYLLEDSKYLNFVILDPIGSFLKKYRNLQQEDKDEQLFDFVFNFISNPSEAQLNGMDNQAARQSIMKVYVPYLKNRFLSNDNGKVELKEKLTRILGEFRANGEKAIGEFFKIADMDVNGKEVPIVNECKNQFNFYGNLKKTILNDREKYSYQFDYDIDKNPDCEIKCLEYIKKFNTELYNKIEKETDETKRSQLIKEGVLGATEFEFHYITGVGLTNQNELLTVEGLATTTSEFISTPVTSSPAIGVYQNYNDRIKKREIDKTKKNSNSGDEEVMPRSLYNYCAQDMTLGMDDDTVIRAMLNAILQTHSRKLFGR